MGNLGLEQRLHVHESVLLNHGKSGTDTIATSSRRHLAIGVGLVNYQATSKKVYWLHAHMSAYLYTRDIDTFDPNR